MPSRIFCHALVLVVSWMAFLLTTLPVQATSPDLDWFRGARYGVFIHFLPGNSNELNSVNQFDALALSQQLESAGASYLFITLGQNSGFFIAPNKTLDRFTGRSPGQECSVRDLPMELAASLKDRGIRLFLYLPCQAPNQDPVTQKAFGLPVGPKDQPIDLVFARKWAEVIEEWSTRYGDQVAGWWFDGAYDHVGFNESIARIYCDAVKRGNPHALVAFNNGVKPKALRHAQAEDYTAGEFNEPLGVFPEFPTVDGAQWHALTYLGSGWATRNNRFTSAQWTQWVKRATSLGGVITLDSGPNLDPQAGPIGMLSTNHLEQLRAIRSAVYGDNKEGNIFEIAYPPGNAPGGLKVGVTYTLWLPPDVPQFRGVIVHQHGCGAPACRAGATAAFDLHWQALARKWNCALLGPSYQQNDQQECSLWCDPRQGSDQSFLKALEDLAVQTGHPELAQVPWCLWGHSGGAYWSGLMQRLHPERIVSIWFRSGTAALSHLGGSTNELLMPQLGYQIPAMFNPGTKENGDARFQKVWTTSLEAIQDLRAHDAPVGLAPDPRTGHECGDSRYLAIPFFDASLGMRLPDQFGSTQLKPIDWNQAWLAKPLSTEAVSAATFNDNPKHALWLPNARLAQAWMEYVKTGAVSDLSPPPKPSELSLLQVDSHTIDLKWSARADFESGLRAFEIQRDGEVIAQLPSLPVGKFGRPLFQSMSYHDTPEKPIPNLRFVDHSANPTIPHQYRVITINSVGLRSEPSAVVESVASDSLQ